MGHKVKWIVFIPKQILFTKSSMHFHVLKLMKNNIGMRKKALTKIMIIKFKEFGDGTTTNCAMETIMIQTST